MKGPHTLPLLSTLLLILVACSSAWPWPASFHKNINALIGPRQEERPTESASSSASSTASNTDRATITPTGSATVTGSASRSGSGSGTGSTASKSGTKTTSSKTTAIDPRLPPGGIALITPAAIDGPQYYRVGEYITFQWNYTSLSVTPSAIDVLASCALNSATYTLASNMSVNATGAVTWDTGNFPAAATDPFPVASYTLVVMDASKDITDIPSAGYLAAYNQYVFGMYTGQPYTPLNEFKCATCNGAFSIHEKQAFGVVVMTAAITVVSFTWFATGFGVFS